MKMGVGPFDFTMGDIPSNLAARICPSENVRIEIRSPFAVYLAQTDNAELFDYLKQSAADIERFISAIEARIANAEKNTEVQR